MESILITGASGFVGQYVANFFKDAYKLVTLGLMPGDDLVCDLSKEKPVISQSFDAVIHLAGKAHQIPRNDDDAKVFFDVNYNGLLNLLTAITESGLYPKKFLFFSSVSVYGLDIGNLVTEKTPMNASDPYGKSKAMGETLLQEWGKEHGVIITILRPPLIVGKNAPGNLGDMVTAISKGRYFNIDGGKARRSMVLADDIAPFIVKVWDIGGVYHITDGHHPSFKELSDAITGALKKKKTLNVPYFIVYMAAIGFDFISLLLRKPMPVSVYKLRKMRNSYTFDDALARSVGWQSRSVVSCVNNWVR